MPAERYYSSNSLVLGSTFDLIDVEFHHLVHVMRAKAGDSIEIIDGSGTLAVGEILAIEKKKAIISIKTSEASVKSPISIILAQALPRLNRLDFILEKGTELGATELWLFPGDRSERKELSDHQLERYQSVTIAASKQSGRLFVPKIALKPALKHWEKPTSTLFFGDVSPQAMPFRHLFNQATPTEMIFFIGPESGFSDAEETILKGWQAEGIHLHPNILRTDTAGIAALSLMSCWAQLPKTKSI